MSAGDTARPTRILILGRGFGGDYAAMRLEKKLAREIKRRDVEIGLVSLDNYLIFQPMLPEVLSGSLGIVDTIALIRRLCPRMNLYPGAIEEERTGMRREPANGFAASNVATALPARKET
jgi:NADH dehydrogenase